MMRAFVKSYGESSTDTLSPGTMRMKCFRILPEICASTLRWPVVVLQFGGFLLRAAHSYYVELLYPGSVTSEGALPGTCQAAYRVSCSAPNSSLYLMQPKA